MRLFRERLDYGLIFAADDHLKLAIERKRSDRERGVRADEWKAFMTALTEMPTGMTQNEYARAVLALPIPGWDS